MSTDIIPPYGMGRPSDSMYEVHAIMSADIIPPYGIGIHKYFEAAL